MVVEECLMEAFPNLSEEIKLYVVGVLSESNGEFESGGDVFEAIGDILLSAHESVEESAVMDLCEKLCDMVNIDAVRKPDIKALNRPVFMHESNGYVDDRSVENSMWSKSRAHGPSMVDAKKLEKSEAKLKKKQEKRDQQSNSAAQQPARLVVNSEATASQASNSKATKLENRGQNNNSNVQIENVDVSFGAKQLLSGADLTLIAGRRYGLVGRNGVGKTTLLKMISSGHLNIPSRITILHVEQEIVGDDTLVLDSVLASDTKRAALIAEEQSIQQRLTTESTNDLSSRLAEVYEELTAIEADKAPSRAASILYGLGFSPTDQRRTTKEFSGGWRMRLALARALFMKPDLLLLDEPTNMLDMKAIYWLENYLSNWPTTLLVVSHARNFLNSVATDMVHMHSKRLDYYSGNYDVFVRTKTEKLKNQQREYEAQQQLREHVQVFIDRFRYNANRAALVQSKIKMLERLPILHPVEFEPDVVFSFPPCDRINPPIIELDEVAFRYSPDQDMLFKSVQLNTDLDSRICIVGENGAGKTTLLKLMMGDLKATKGEVKCGRLLRLSYFTQHHVDQLVMNVSPVLLMEQRFPGLPQETYRAALGRFGVSGDMALQAINSLSGGQKSRLAFANLSMQRPNFLILDEPTNHLDIETVEALGAALNEFQGGVVLVSHDERLIELVCKELWVLKDNSVRRLEGGLAEYRKIIEAELAEQK